MQSLRTTWMAMLLAGAASVSVCAAQASYTEGFDNVGSVNAGQHGPSNLIAGGWIFRNQSQPSGTGTWFGGSNSPQSGAGLLRANSMVSGTWNGSAVASSWAILPAIPGQMNGDLMRFFVRNADYPCCNPHARLQVRYSPGGGTSTGLGANDVGSFTTLLLDIADVENTPWTEHSVALPGNGRLAFRFYLPSQPTGNDFFGDFDIDSLSVGTPAPGPFPLPQAGQTVTWTPAMNPIVIQGGTVRIPAGGKVVVQPGTHVQVGADSTLLVEGTLTGAGTPASPLTFSAAAVYPPMISVEGGTLDLTYAQIAGQLRPLEASTLSLTDSMVSGNGLIWTGGIYSAQPFVSLDGVTFANSSLTTSDCLVVLKNVTMNNSSAQFIRGYVDTSGGVTLNGRPMAIDFESQIQPVAIDHVSVTGVSAAAGLQLSGGNFALGPGNVLQNNLYPVEVQGGLMPESTVPATGNASNRIYAASGGGLTHYSLWPDLAIPWFVDGIQDNPDRIIAPGTMIEFGPAGGARYRSTARLIAKGLPGAPITFQGAAPGQAWGIFSSDSNHDPVDLDYCEVRGSSVGVSAGDALIWVKNSVFENNAAGVNANTYGVLFAQKSLFKNNGAAATVTDNGYLALSFPDAPNAFTSNVAAIETLGFYAQSDARNNWWGQSSGPQSPLNPGGTGDSITGPGAFGVQVSPFLSSSPDFANHPPVVRLVEPGYTVDPIEPAYHFEPGQKLLLTWTATDDDAIVSQKILLSASGNTPWSFMTIADGLPPGIRTYELTLPAVGFDPAYWLQFIRVVAVDSRGQEGWDEMPCTIAAEGLVGNVTSTSPGAGQTFYAGDEIPAFSREVTGFEGMFPTVTDYLIFEMDGSIYLSGGPVGRLPNVSSDLVRFWTEVRNNSNDVRWFPGPYITIRHDPRLGFVPPVVQLETPAAGASYPGAALVPITWTATAAEGLRSFDIQASTDGGRFWRTIATELPETARRFDWQLPAISGAIGDARVRVVVRDKRFQNSSDGTDRSFAIVPGSWAPGEAGGAGSLRARRGPGTSVRIDYDPACEATDHAAYWGMGPITGSLQWTSSACGLGTSGTASFDPGNPPAGGLLYFVVVGQNTVSEGSYGRSSSGAERPESIGVGACNRPQATAGGCGLP